MYKKRNLTEQRFGNLVVIKSLGYYKPNDRHFWSLVKCDCGNVFPIQDTYLVNNRQTKCADCSRKANAKHLMTNSRIYHVYQSMKGRCCNPNNPQYSNYGGRGIKICQEWLEDSGSFIKWAYATGYDDIADYMQCTLDRIDVNGDYCPENCRWINNKEQARNKRDTRYMIYRNEKKSVMEVSEITGIKASTIKYRLDNGYSDDEAISIDVGSEIMKSKVINHEVKRHATLIDQRTKEKILFDSCSAASRFLGFNSGYLSNVMRKRHSCRFEIGGYYVKIGEQYN